MLKDLKTFEFVNTVDSKSPAPGGGSVSALASSLGAALLRMVGHLSISKKKFKELDEEVQAEFIARFDSLLLLKELLIELIDKDTLAFNEIMAAFKLPKETDNEKAFRSNAIQEATLFATKVPFEVVEVSLEALENIDFILQYGNKNTISDIGVAALMLYSGIEGAILNVKINLSGLKDENIKNDFTKKINSALEEATTLKDRILEEIHNAL